MRRRRRATTTTSPSRPTSAVEVSKLFCRIAAVRLRWSETDYLDEGNDRGAAQGDQADALRAGGDAHLRALVRGLSAEPSLNNIVEQDHRAIKRIARPMLGFKSFRCARVLIAGIETVHMIRKGQLDRPEGRATSAASQFYSLAF